MVSMKKKVLDKVGNIVRKGGNLLRSIFSFFHNVFKSSLCQVHFKSVLWGKELLQLYHYYCLLGMGTNTKTCIRIFGITSPIYLNIRFWRSCLCRFRGSFLCPGTGHIRKLVQHAINLRCGKFGLLVYVKLFLDHL